MSGGTRAQRAAEGQAIVQALQALMPLGAIKPDLFEIVDVDAAARAIAGAFGAPASLMRAPEEVEAARAANAQQAMMQGLAGAAGPISGAIKNLADAGKTGTETLGADGLTALLGTIAGGAAPDAAAALVPADG